MNMFVIGWILAMQKQPHSGLIKKNSGIEIAI
jgi:hypothetical protein